MSKRVKNVFAWHHWCGLVAGAFLLVLTLSGSVLVFHEELDRLLWADDYALAVPARALALDRSFEAVRRRHPGWEIRVPVLPESPTETLKYELRQAKRRQWVFAHPETGRLLRTVTQADQRFVNQLLTLHYSFFAGTAGKALVCLCGAAFLVLLGTGVVLYRKALGQVLRFRQGVSLRSRRAFFSSLHRVLGVWGLASNLVICVTGLWMGQLVLTSALSSKPAAVAVPALGISLDALLRTLHRQYPAFEIHALRFPAAADAPLQVAGRLASDPAYYGAQSSRLQINYRTGRVEAVQLVRDKPLGGRVAAVLPPLHFGDYGGVGLKILYCLGGLLPAVLSISGFVVWRHRGRAKTKSQAGKKQFRPHGQPAAF